MAASRRTRVRRPNPKGKNIRPKAPWYIQRDAEGSKPKKIRRLPPPPRCGLPFNLNVEPRASAAARYAPPSCTLLPGSPQNCLQHQQSKKIGNRYVMWILKYVRFGVARYCTRGSKSCVALGGLVSTPRGVRSTHLPAALFACLHGPRESQPVVGGQAQARHGSHRLRSSTQSHNK